MAIQPTAQIGNPIIRQKTQEVIDVSDPDIQKTIEDLIDSMRHENLVGMAAPQVGKPWRIFVTEIRQTTFRKNIAEIDALRIFINPVITWQSEEEVNGYEGCGSVAAAQLFGPVKRVESLVCEALDQHGKHIEVEASGFLARVINHEIDHLDGIVFLDKVQDTRTLMDKQTYIDSQKK